MSVFVGHQPRSLDCGSLSDGLRLLLVRLVIKERPAKVAATFVKFVPVATGYELLDMCRSKSAPLEMLFGPLGAPPWVNRVMARALRSVGVLNGAASFTVTFHAVLETLKSAEDV